MLGLRLLVLFVLLAGYVGWDVSQIAIWRSDATLWAHAVVVTPLKPRPWRNHLKALFAEGRDAEWIAAVPHVAALEAWRGRR